MRQTIILVLAVLLGLYVFIDRNDWFFEKPIQEPAGSSANISHLFENRISNAQVEGAGSVKAILRDDLKGSRHQKFILTLPNGITVLISHNIDLAPRIDTIKIGDQVAFYGEYEWNNKGGVIHWTHHDPKKKHIGGWLKHNNRIYR